MKANYIVIISLFLIASSCKSLQHHLDNGDYDRAIEVAARKMRGDHHKKTKHVKAAERAFRNANRNDMEEIHFLMSRGGIDFYEEVLRRTESIAIRQNIIRPFLPLVSKSGYEARVDLIDLYPFQIEAQDKIVALSYEKGLELLAKARANSDKIVAREAYYSFRRILDFEEGYKNVHALMDEALELGIVHVELLTKFYPKLFISSTVIRFIESTNLVIPNTKWTKFYNASENTLDADFIFTLNIDDVIISPERESERLFVAEKEVEDGVEYTFDENGNVAKDSLGNDIKIPKFSLVRAEVSELIRRKDLHIYGTIEFFDKKQQRSYSEAIEGSSEFHDITCIVEGDLRALSEDTKKHVKSFPLRFPSDEELLLNTTEEVKMEFQEIVFERLESLPYSVE